MEENMELTEVFGSNVFNDKVMKERLPKADIQGAEGDDRQGHTS